MTQRLYRKHVDPEFRAFNEKLSQRIKSLRIEKNLNQDDFAREADIHRSHVSSLENTKYDPTLSTLFKIAKALDITVSELLDFKVETDEA